MVTAVLAAVLALAAAEKPASPTTLPPLELVLAMRTARVQELAGNPDEARTTLLETIRSHPGELAPLLAYRSLARNHPSEEHDAQVRKVLALRLEDLNRPLPEAELEQLVEDQESAPEELAATLQAIQRRLSEGPEDTLLLDATALLQTRLGRHAKARETLGRLLSIRWNPRLAHRAIRLDERLGRWESALALVDRLLQSKPKSMFLVSMRVSFLAQLGRTDEVLAVVAATEELEDLGAETLTTAAWLAWDAAKDADAERLFRKAAEMDEDQMTSAKAALLHLFGSSKERAAFAAAEKTRIGEVDDAAELLKLGTDRLVAGDDEEAAALLSRATASDPESELAWFNLGLAYSRLERWAEAVNALRKAVRLHARRAESWFNLGAALFRLDRCNEALAPLDRALELDGTMNQVHYYLYACHSKLGHDEIAARHRALYNAGQ